LYNHTAIFPQDKYPRGMRANGHLLLNGDKMSKSTGNFLSLYEAIEKYTADATRLILADAGDAVDDANFEEKSANAAILRLHSYITWVNEILDKKRSNEEKGLRTGEFSRVDYLFETEINLAIQRTTHAYDRTNYREAVMSGIYNLQAARDYYKLIAQQGMHVHLIHRYIEVQTLLMAPITPHSAEHVWKLLGKEGFVVKGRWPVVVGGIDEKLVHEFEHLKTIISAFRAKLSFYIQPKKNQTALPPPTKAIIFVATEFPVWQQKFISYLRSMVNEETKELPSTDHIAKAMTVDAELKPNVGAAMKMMDEIRADLKEKGLNSLELRLPFEETHLIEENLEYISKAFGLTTVQVLTNDNQFKERGNPVPGKPTIVFS